MTASENFTLSLLREAIKKHGEKLDVDEESISYVSHLTKTLAAPDESGNSDYVSFDPEDWRSTCVPYLSSGKDDKACATEVVEIYRHMVESYIGGEDGDGSDSDEDGDDPTKTICDIRFNLAYGGMILLHRTRLKLKRGHRYGLVGQNGTGKTTLMNAINNGKLDGWPSGLRTEYVDSGSNVDANYEKNHVLVYLQNITKKPEASKAILDELNFTEDMIAGTIGELSGGWQMKLRLCRAVLMDADILLLDEPTNHLDKATVGWLTRYLQSLTDTTVLCVSHDTPFMEKIGTDVIHYEKRAAWGPHRKLVNYRGTMSAFVKKQPQAAHYFKLAKTSSLSFKFPNPGRLEGIRTTTQKFLEMEDVSFRYPGAETDQISDVSVRMTLASRVSVTGANGAGKTTLVRMIVGEALPTNVGQCRLWKHHNLRVAYVAQHSFHHVEKFVASSPVAYLQWRFKDGYDREKIESEAFHISDDEQKLIDDFMLEGIWSRRVRAGKLEYEVKKRNVLEKNNKYYSKDDLLAMGFVMLLKQTDEKIAAVEAGLDRRSLTTKEIQKHLDDFGLVQDFGTYGKIGGLSGGQKVKLVLAAAMWNCPHLLILDEPTNFLDREALGALSAALNEWGGAVLMISHNHEFYSSVCREEWVVADGKVKVVGASEERAMKAVARKKVVEKEATQDAKMENAGGNMNADGDKLKDASVDFWGKTLSKKDFRAYVKAKKRKDIDGMRKILLIPMGKIMPGHEGLGDGKVAKK